MSQNRFRQIARLEKLAKPHLEAGRRAEREWQSTLEGAAAHAASFAFLIRYGNPTIGEPLSLACQRVSESSAWRECCEKFPAMVMMPHGEYSFEPHNRDHVAVIGRPLRHAVISRFPGADEKEKLDAVFGAAPPWLIWFTFGDYTAKLLGLTLPDLSGVTGFARSKANFDLWWGLPREAFESSPWAEGPENEPLARTDLSLLRPARQLPDSTMTPREQKRARATYLKSDPTKRTDEWPMLLPSELLEKQFELPKFLRPRDLGARTVGDT
jgi:hypothetical protein